MRPALSQDCLVVGGSRVLCERCLGLLLFSAVLVVACHVLWLLVSLLRWSSWPFVALWPLFTQASMHAMQTVCYAGNAGDASAVTAQCT